MPTTRSSRRRFLGSVAALGAVVPGPRAAAAAAEAVVDDTRVISMRPDLYHGWPTLARRSGGELLVVCSGGRDAHVCPFGWVELMRSRDDGESWHWPTVLMDTPIDDRDAGACETADGTLLVTTFTSIGYAEYLQRATPWAEGRFGTWTPQRIQSWKAAHTRLSVAEREDLVGTWMLRSTDGGATWSRPYRVPVNSPHGPTPLSDGRILYAGKRLYHPERRIGVAESQDDGQNWRWLAEIPTRDGDDYLEYHELHMVEAGSGRLVAQIRNHNPANERETLQSVSDDGGRTWSVPRPIGVWGLPSHLLRLRDGRLLMSYGHRRAPFGNMARISGDEGSSWSAPLTLSGDGDNEDLGYPSTVQLADGSLVTVWYERTAASERAVLRQAKWRLRG